MAWAVQASCQRLGESQSKGARISAPRFDQTHAKKTMQSSMISPDRLLGFWQFATDLTRTVTRNRRPIALRTLRTVVKLARADVPDQTSLSELSVSILVRASGEAEKKMQ